MNMSLSKFAQVQTSSDGKWTSSMILVESRNVTPHQQCIYIYYFTRSVLFNWQSNRSESWTISGDVANSIHLSVCNVVTGRQQPSSMMNVHYHANLSCPHVRCLSFNPAEVEIPKGVGTKLSAEQWLFLIRTFGID